MACPSGTIEGCQFTQYLVDQQPNYDKLIIEDIRPSEGWIAHVDTGTFENHTGTQHTRDRFNNVYPDTTQEWNLVEAANCLGTPCDPTENTIGWGSTRLTYALEQQSWQTPLLCFDQLMHVTKSVEQFRYIISKILKPATNLILSNFYRKRGLYWADTKVAANAQQTPFTFSWVKVGTREVYFDTNIAPQSIFKLTPQMLQRYVEPLMRVGYMGEMPFANKDNPPMLQLVTDMETTWELDRLGGSTGFGTTPNVPTMAANWRFTQWDAASKYWAYGFSGQIGNYTVRADLDQLRFNFVGLVGGNYRYQIVLPMRNVPSSGAGGASGLKSEPNPDYQRAQFAISYIWHPKGIQALVSESGRINSEMPFANRNFGGKWQFVMDNLGADINGVAINNKRRNKGQFIGDFKLAIAPFHTEFLVAFFHKREPSCIVEINTCNPNPGYPTQNYNSANTECGDDEPYTLQFTPTLNSATGFYDLAANSVTCEGGQVAHAQVTGSATLATLVVQLNSILAPLGTWTVVNGTTIQVVGTCSSVGMPWIDSQ